MYKSPPIEVRGSFHAPNLSDLAGQYGVGPLPKKAWRNEKWSEHFDQEHPTRTKFRLEQGEVAPLEEDLARVVGLWHADVTYDATIGGPNLTGTVIASAPVTTRIIQGDIPGLPSIDDERGRQELARLVHESYHGNLTLHELAQKALDLGHADEVTLHDDKTYFMPKGLIHIRPSDATLRIVGQSHPDIPVSVYAQMFDSQPAA